MVSQFYHHTCSWFSCVKILSSCPFVRLRRTYSPPLGTLLKMTWLFSAFMTPRVFHPSHQHISIFITYLYAVAVISADEANPAHFPWRAKFQSHPVAVRAYRVEPCQYVSVKHRLLKRHDSSSCPVRSKSRLE